MTEQKAWELVRGAEAAKGKIVSVTVHIRLTEGEASSSFFKTLRELLDEGFDQPRGRVTVVWGEREADIETTANLWFYYGGVEAAHLLAVCRNLAGKTGFGEEGRLQVTCTIEYPSRNQLVIINDVTYPARGVECVVDISVLKPFKAVSSSGEYVFSSAHELREFLKTVKGAKTYVYEEKTGKWIRWVEVEQLENELVINIPTASGFRKLVVDLDSGKIKEEEKTS
ncbi:MAG: hypothetical protein ACFFCO_05435 [Promethearchaeota archaeon]